MAVRSYTGEKYYFVWEITVSHIRTPRQSRHFWMDDNKLIFMFGARETDEGTDDLGLRIIFFSKPKTTLEISTYIREDCGRLQLLSCVREDFAPFKERDCGFDDHYCARLLSHSGVEQLKVTKDKHMLNSTFTFIFSLTDIVECFSDIEKKKVLGKPTIHQQLCLEKLSDDMKDLFESQTDTDIELKCKDRTLRAHRNILAARSKMLRDVLQYEWQGSKTEVINIRDISSETIVKFLTFLYSGKIELSKGTVLQIYEAADRYWVTTLRNMCASFMVENLETYKIEDICNILDLAHVCDNKSFLDTVVDFAVQKEGFISSLEWLELAEESFVLAGNVFMKYYRTHSIV